MAMMERNVISLKLAIELIPEPCWGMNLRSVLPDSRWTKISRQVREAASGKCQICDGTTSVQCDEQWTYDAPEGLPKEQ
jgi:hypothetical protein